MSKLHSNMLELIGNTPIVKVSSLEVDNLWGKIEYLNPAGSVKDRAAYNMLEKAMERDEIDKNTTIIEPTSGNTGVGLAFCCAIMGLKFIAIMPDNMGFERIEIIKAYGGKVILTPRERGMQGSVDEAKRIAKKIKKEGKKAFVTMQFQNQDNPLAHLKTADEIFEDTQGKVDIIVAGIGSGGTISGLAKRLKELKPTIKVIGVEPKDSPLITEGRAGMHKLQGIGANFIPKTLDLSLIDEIIDVTSEDAYYTAKHVAREDGMLVGISSGAALYAAAKIAKKYKDLMVLTILPDSGERYLAGDLYA